MNEEKRFRDMMRRLVAMSPEAPDFPEETLMAKHTPSKPRPNPVLMFAAGAALVAAVMIPVFLISRGDAPVGVGTTTTTTAPSTTTAPDTATTTTQATTTTVPDNTSSTQPVESVWSRPVFLYQTPANSFLGNPALVPVWLELTDTGGTLSPDDEFTAALAVLGTELPELPASSGLANAVPAEVQIISLTTATQGADQSWVADMNEAFLAGAGGLLADVTMLNQLIYTITDNTLGSVLFTVNGQPVEAFGSEGIVLTDPVDRETFIEHLAPIFLTTPVIDGEDGYTVAGKANVFEASLSVQVLDGSGGVVHEEHLMASCGSGCWGEFSVDLDPGLITPGESSVRLFTYSAEDGSMTNVLTVPIPADSGVWEITVG